MGEQWIMADLTCKVEIKVQITFTAEADYKSFKDMVAASAAKGDKVSKAIMGTLDAVEQK